MVKNDLLRLTRGNLIEPLKQQQRNDNDTDNDTELTPATRNVALPLELHVSLVIPWWILLSRRRMLSENSLRSDGSSSSKMPA